MEIPWFYRHHQDDMQLFWSGPPVPTEVFDPISGGSSKRVIYCLNRPRAGY